jgi:hypothetical protein
MKIIKNSISFSPLVPKILQNNFQEISFIEGFVAISRICPNFSKNFNYDFIDFPITKVFNIE